MSNSSSHRFSPGPAVTDGGLLSWLETNARRPDGKKRRFRIPVACRFEDEHRLAIASAVVGTSLDGGSGQTIALAVDDSALGVGLLDTLRTRCPAGAPGCAVWLEGYFAPLLETRVAVLAPPAGQHPFAVLAVGELVGGGEAHALMED